MMQKQLGMTFVGMLLTVAAVVLIAVTIMRAVPVYLQHYTLVKSIKSLSTVPQDSLSGDPAADVIVLRKDLTKRLDINGIDDLKDNELIITPDVEHKFQVKLKYQVVKYLAYNVSLLFDFDDTIEVVAGSEN